MAYKEEDKRKLIPEEIIENNPLALTTLHALVSVCADHNKLGVEGKEKDVINQFGEQALKADLAAEQYILRSLETYASSRKIVIEVNGEETAVTNLGSEGQKYFGVLDGLDGSVNYLNPGEWSYGTMLSIAKGNNPKYSDFEVSGIALPEESWVLIAIKGSGVFVYDIGNKKYTKLNAFLPVQYDQLKILSDNYFIEAKNMLGKMQDVWPRTGSTAATIIAIATGGQIENQKYPKMNNIWQGLADVTRKGNLEQPALYLILSELGGVMIDKEGLDIGNNYFREWGQNEKIPVVSATSIEVANRILSELTLN